MKLEHIVAIPGVCAWPNLTQLPDGTIVAAIWNQPCHGKWEGDLDCWGSEYGGRSWQFRGRIAAHQPGTNRMNCAAGLTGNGDLMVVVSGWSDRDVVGTESTFEDPVTLRSWVCRSSDGGYTWTKTGELPTSGQRFEYIPFGDLQHAEDGALCVSVYIRDDEEVLFHTFVMRSYDDGQSWSTPTILDPDGNETAILHLREGQWIATSRRLDRRLYLFRSEDDGRTWSYVEVLTRPYEITSHLLRLQDGRILLSYGNRIRSEAGVEARLSDDEGQSWGAPFRLADMPPGDGGYPSSVQRADGMMVTAYYSKHPDRGPYQYEMNVVFWNPDEANA